MNLPWGQARVRAALSSYEPEESDRRGRPQALSVRQDRLLVVVWHVLAKQTADTEANPEMVASKFIGWSGRLGVEGRGGLTTRRFVRYHLMKLKLGDDLKGVRQGRTTRLLASPEEVLALRPELKSVC